MDSLFDREFLEEMNIGSWGYTEESLAHSYNQFTGWLASKKEGKLQYLSGERGEKRSDIRMIFPDFQSALVFLFPYPKTFQDNSQAKIAHYALGFGGEDYHFYLKEKLETIATYIKNKLGAFSYKLSLDVLPILERDLAFRSGLGWFGKNSMLINRELGSYTIIGSVLISIKIPGLQRPSLDTDHCGTCTKCIDACPTSAIDPENRTIIANKCISTYTIETFKAEKPPPGYSSQNLEIFGCDICQEVCPWNDKDFASEVYEKSSKLTLLEDFFLHRNLSEILQDLESMSNREYKKMFKATALERPGRIGMIKNLKAIQGDQGHDYSYCRD